METLSQHHIFVMLLSLGVLLAVARVLGELAQKMRQPAIVGELLAGVLLGPTVLGSLAPGISESLFPAVGPNAIALDAITNLAIVLFLLVAGLEVDLSTVWEQGWTGARVGVASIVVPFAIGFAVAWFAPQAMGRHPEGGTLTFALFFATALSISALPVIAKTLMDMDLYRSDLGMVVVSAAIFNDLIGWIIFAIVLGLMGGVGGHETNIVATILLTLVFAGAMLTLGRWLIHKILPFLQAYTKWPGGVLGFAITLALFGAAFTEWIGIHAIFGSFLVGVAIGDSSHLRERTRVTIDHFVSFIFAPVFFASIGLKVNFLSDFNLPLVLTVLLVATACKLVGGVLGARWAGMSRHESWAVGFAMNSRGAMEIILGMLALQAGIIHNELFVALVVMAIATSMISGPAMRLVLRPEVKRRLSDLLSSKLFVGELEATTPQDAIHALSKVACGSIGLDSAPVEAAVWERECLLSTGIGNGVAIPHARVPGLAKSLITVGISDVGVNFDSPDGDPARVIFLVLTPREQPSEQLEIGAEIARSFRDPRLVDRVLRTRSFVGLVSLLRSTKAENDAL